LLKDFVALSVLLTIAGNFLILFFLGFSNGGNGISVVLTFAVPLLVVKDVEGNILFFFATVFLTFFASFELHMLILILLSLSIFSYSLRCPHKHNSDG